MKRKLKPLLCLLLILVVVLSLTACGNNTLTWANYDKIKCGKLNYNTAQYEGGMTLSEVAEILGNVPYVSEGKDPQKVTWGNDNKCIVVVFMNGVAAGKSQKGL